MTISTKLCCHEKHTFIGNRKNDPSHGERGHLFNNNWHSKHYRLKVKLHQFYNNLMYTHCHFEYTCTKIFDDQRKIIDFTAHFKKYIF